MLHSEKCPIPLDTVAWPLDWGHFPSDSPPLHKENPRPYTYYYRTKTGILNEATGDLTLQHIWSHASDEYNMGAMLHESPSI